MNRVMSLFDLATNTFVRHASLLSAYIKTIPPVLYQSLLKASMETDRILSIRQIFLYWPLQKLSLVNCGEFQEQYAIILAHSLQSGCNKLREIDLSGCNIGVHGTTSLLTLVAGQSLPNVSEYCSKKDKTDKNTAGDKNRDCSDRLSIMTNCYVDENNYELFLDVLEGDKTIHDFTVSYFYAIALGVRRIQKILNTLAIVQAESVTGLDVSMNDLTLLPENGHQCYILFGKFQSLQYLNLSTNPVLLAICNILEHISAPLTHLILNNCCLRVYRFAFINSFLLPTSPCVKKLQHLEIANNQIREIDGHIMEFLRKCSGTLSFLSLKSNRLTDTAVPAILKLLEAPFVLETLYIGENKFTVDSKKLLHSKDKMHKIQDCNIE